MPTKGSGSAEASGSVTVFLTLIFLVMFSFILVMVETARYSAAKAYSKLAAFSAGESVLGGYYGPLYDDYGIYAVDLGFGKKTPDIKKLEEELAKYALVNDPVNELKSCTVTEVGNLIYDGDAEFMRQIRVNAETELAGEAVELLLEKIGLLNEQDKKVSEYERAAEIEKEFVVLDEKKLLLMKLIDGIDMTDIVNGKSGYKIADIFVKKPMPSNTAASLAQINHPKLRSAMAGHYTDMSQIVAAAEYAAYEYSNLSYWIGEILLKEEALSKEAAELEAEIEALVSREKTEPEAAEEGETESEAESEAPETVESEELKELKEKLKEVLAEARELAQNCHEMEEERELKKITYKSCMRSLESVLSESVTASRAAVSVCSEAEKEQGHLAELLNNLEEGFTDELLETMQEYAGLKKGNSGTDFTAIRNRLNELIAFEEGLIGQIRVSGVDSGNTTDIKYGVLSVSYSGLAFDYSGYRPVDGTAEKIETGIMSGISEMLLEFISKDGTVFSDSVLDIDLLPSRAKGEELSQTGDEGASSLKELFKGAAEGIADKALAAVYAKEHFKSYRTFSSKGDTALAYEMEYLICNSASDRVNLSETAGRILLVRLAASGAYVLSNSECRAAALEAATLLLGFTGVPFLVAAAKYIILTVWAFEQAVIETAAVVQGQKVPLLTKKTCLSIGEIPLFGHGMICEKVSSIKPDTVSLTYDDYLLLFLACTDIEKLCSRMQDLMQENIRYRYNEDFLMVNCITSFRFASVSRYCPGYLSDMEAALQKEGKIIKPVRSEYFATY